MTRSRPSSSTSAYRAGLFLAVLGLVITEWPLVVQWGLPLTVLGLTVWAWRAAPRARIRWLAPALAALAWTWALIGGPARPGSERWRHQTSRSYVEVWERLDVAATRAAEAVSEMQPPGTDAEPSTDRQLRNLFGPLERHSGGATVLLVRNAGQVVAWTGPALPMDLGGEGADMAAALPTRGGSRAFVRPASITLTVTKPLAGEAWRGWLVAAGRTFDSSRLPWSPGLSLRWSVDEGGGPAPGVLQVDGGEWPDLWMPEESRHLDRPAPAVALWLALVAIAVAVVISLTSKDTTQGERWFGCMAVAAATLAVCPTPFWAALGCLIAAAIGQPIADLSKRRGDANGGVDDAWGPISVLTVGMILALLGGILVVLTVGTAPGSEVRIAGLRPVAAGTWLLLALVATVTWVLYQVCAETRREERLSPLTVVAVVSLLTAAAMAVDHPLPVLVLCVVVVVLLWRGRGRLSTVAWVMVAATLMATLWTAGQRLTLAQAAYRQRHLASTQTSEERRDLRRQIEDSLIGRDVLSLSLGQSSIGSIESLAYGLWHSSNLDDAGLDSVLVATSEGRPLSTYEAGLSRMQLSDEQLGDEAEDTPAARPLLGPPTDNPEPVQRGSGELLFGGNYFSELEFAWQPEPGYRWHRSTRLSPPVVVTASASVPTSAPRSLDTSPGSLSNAFSLLSADGNYRLTLPSLGALASLERVAARAALALFAIALLIGLADSGLVADRWLSRINALRTSYPRRLALTLGGLILVPLSVVNLAILTLHERDLRAERERLEQAALESARRAIYNRLDSLPANFALNTALNDDVLAGFASIVGRPVDLYWNSRLYASSRQQRFEAEELGGRLPAPIYTSLVLGDVTQMRYDATRSGGEVGVYATLERFDTETGPNLILAVPVSGEVDELVQAARSLRSRTLLIAFGVLLLAFWATARAARNFSRPILEMIAGTERIAAGADSLGIELPREQDLGRLATAIDRMAADVTALQRSERLERDLVEQILANVTTGVVLVDESGRIGRTNPVAQQMLGLEVGQRLPDDLGADLAGLPAFTRLATEGAAANQKVTVEIDGEARQWQVASIPVESPAGRASLLVVEDVTEVVRGERLAAWAEMARVIAHEIKNPLTPIRLSAEHLRELFRPHDDPGQAAAVDRCTSNILEQVEDLRQIANEFSDYSRIPEVRPEPFAVVDWVNEVVNSYQPDAEQGRVEVRIEVDRKLSIDADRRLLTRVLRNLLENALRAGGEAPVSVEISTQTEDRLRIAVRDRGSGVAKGDLDRIFEPYFSTHETGTGLGLPISRRIVEAHGGAIEARRRDSGGLCVIVLLPM